MNINNILKLNCFNLFFFFGIKDDINLHSFLPHFFSFFFGSAFNSTPLFSSLKVMKHGFAFKILQNDK